MITDLERSLLRRTQLCSFCERTEYEVRNLVAADRAFICDDCTGDAVRVIAASHKDWAIQLVKSLVP